MKWMSLFIRQRQSASRAILFMVISTLSNSKLRKISNMEACGRSDGFSGVREGKNEEGFGTRRNFNSGHYDSIGRVAQSSRRSYILSGSHQAIQGADGFSSDLNIRDC